MDVKRRDVTFQQVIKPWLDEVYRILREYKPDPALVINIDETPLYYSPSNGHVFVPSEMSAKPIQVTPDKHKTYTVTMAIALSGDSYSSQLIVPEKTAIPKEFNSFKTSELFIDHTESGFQTQESFENYIRECIIPAIDRVRATFPAERQTAVLLLDQHSSRNNPTLLQLCSEKKIEIIPIIAHASHIIQPLDKGVNAVLKRKFSVYFDAIRSTFLLFSFFSSIISSYQSPGIATDTVCAGAPKSNKNRRIPTQILQSPAICLKR